MLSSPQKPVYLAYSQLHNVPFFWNYRIDCIFGVLKIKLNENLINENLIKEFEKKNNNNKKCHFERV